DRVAGESDLFLREGKGFAGGQARLEVDEVKPRDRFGDRMPDLQPRVHLHEVEIALPVEEEFERSGAFVVDRPEGSERDLAHALAQRFVDGGRGGFLDELLVTWLHRAIALPEADCIAVAIRQDLDLDMAPLEGRALEYHRGGRSQEHTSELQ